jgi:hypothetical protein
MWSDDSPRYFKGRLQGDSAAAERSWGAAEKRLLLQGIETFGIGAWSDIRSNLLPAWVWI